ncbi:hypothetical protein AURDEDRAFT_116564 [Auricularia subglabra TFB-10046 SS5]|nr:hypothetical protein AURDEDRAFT_116564 [Auricularia subglabra TFB-10046 SS5]
MTLSSHRLDEQGFKDYARGKYADEPLPDVDAFDCWNVQTGILLVHGFDNEASEALRVANGGKDAELEVRWCTMDRVEHIMMRVEEALRIPRAHWVLAGDKGVLKAETVACNSLMFKCTAPELCLIPKTALDAFERTISSPSLGSRQKAIALFGLIEPLGSDDEQAWEAYVKQRKLYTERLHDNMAVLDDEFEADRAMLKQIRGGTSDILAETGLPIGHVLAAEAAILPHWLDIQDDEGDLRSADITTRIYSLRQPGAVDVKIHFWYKPRYYTVEWCVRVTYRVHDNLAADGIEKKSWTHLLYCGLEDTDKSGRIERWNPREDKRFGLRGADTRSIRRILFGDAGVSLVDTVRLLLASVGIYIKFRVESEGDEEKTEEEIRYDATNRDTFKWVQSTTKYSLFDARWLGVQIRRACTAAIPSDADYIDRGAAPRYEKGEFGEDTDEDESEGDDDNDKWY